MDFLIFDNLWIYALGAMGYALFVVSSYFRSRDHMLVFEAVGCVLVALQWVFLDQSVAAGMNFAFAYVAGCGFFLVRFPVVKHFYPLVFPFCIAVLVAFGTGSTLDFIMFAASIPGLSARYFRDMVVLRSLAASGAVLWLIVNASLGVMAGAMCNSGYLIGHILFFIRHYQENRSTKALSPA